MGSERNGVIPPPEVAQAAKKGLELAQKFRRGDKAVAMQRGRRLAEGRPVSWRDLTALGEFFQRHRLPDQGAQRWGDDENPLPAYVAWLLWGGDAGKAWVGAIMERAGRAMGGKAA